MFISKKVEHHLISNHTLHKSFTYTDATYVGTGINIHESIAPQSDSISQKEITTSYNYYFLKHNFYSIYNNTSFFSFKSSYVNQNNHVLQEKARILSLPFRCFGIGIYQGSVGITDTSTGSFSFVDDSYGNLIDKSISTVNLISESTLQAWFSFDDAYIYKEFPQATIKLRDNSINLNTLTIYKGNFSSGLSGSGYQYNLNGESYAYVSNNSFYNFDKSDFTVSFWLKAPISQSVTTNTTNTIISKKIYSRSQYPFEIQIYNQGSIDNGKLLITRKGYRDNLELPTISLTSSISLNDSIYRHVCFSIENKVLKLYINGSLNAYSNDYENRYDVSNSSKLFIGSTGKSHTDVVSDSYFSGSIDELRIYSSFVTASNLYNTPFNTNIVGSVFYEKGLLVLNNLSGSYANLLQGSGANGFSLTYRSVSQLNEHEILIKKGVNEFNMTMNPSIRVENGLLMNNNVSSSIMSGVFTPYITGIGLYNDSDQLLATAKIREPIKSIKDMSLYFRIKFDM